MIGAKNKIIGIPTPKTKEQHNAEMLEKYKNIIVKNKKTDDVLNSEINMLLSGKQKDIASEA